MSAVVYSHLSASRLLEKKTIALKHAVSFVHLRCENCTKIYTESLYVVDRGAGLEGPKGEEVVIDELRSFFGLLSPFEGLTSFAQRARCYLLYVAMFAQSFCIAR